MTRKPPSPYMTLAAANFFLPYAKARGVSKVARGAAKSSVTKIGFMQAYAKTKGDPKKLKTMMATARQTWDERRNNFVGRHMAQLTLHGEPLYETTGRYKGWPTRRHLGLIMWAMTPDPRGIGTFIVKHGGEKAKVTRANGLSKRRSAGRSATGRGIRIPQAWIDKVMDLTDPNGAMAKYAASPASQGVDATVVRFDINEPALGTKLRDILRQSPSVKDDEIELVLVLHRGVIQTPVGPSGGEFGWDPRNGSFLQIAGGFTKARRETIILHELVHMVQFLASEVLAKQGKAPRPGTVGRGRRGVAVGGRQAYWPPGEAPATYATSDPVEFEAVLSEYTRGVQNEIDRYYADLQLWGMADLETRVQGANGIVGWYLSELQHSAAWSTDPHVLRRFTDRKARRDAIKRIADAGARRIAEREEALAADAAQRPRTATNSRYTSARRDDPELWERVKAKITRGTKGGKAGEWSARKAQLAVAEYQRLGGGYLGPKSPRNALAKWTREDWGTRSGRASLETGERYLPRAAREALTPAEYAETTRAKRAGLRRGEQFTAQPERIARKTAKYRK